MQKVEFKICEACGKNKHVPDEIYRVGKCYECTEKIPKRKKGEKLEFRICSECQEKKHIPDEIYNIGTCYKCQEKKKEENQKPDLVYRKCKSPDCEEIRLVPKFASLFLCDKCKAKRNEQLYKHICSNKECGKEFEKDPSSRTHTCPECRNKKKSNKLLVRECRVCERQLESDKFDGIKRICKECEEKKKNEIKTAFCHYCKKDKIVGTEITKFAIKCKKCSEEYRIKRFTKKVDIERECIDPTCKKKFIGKTARSTQSYCPECKAKREELRKQKILKELNRKHYRTCRGGCNRIFEVENASVPSTYICTECKVDIDKKKTIPKKCDRCPRIVLVSSKLCTFLLCDVCKSDPEAYKVFYEDGKPYRNCICGEKFELKSVKSQIYCCPKHRPIKQETKPRPKFAKKNHFGYFGITSDDHDFDSLNEQDVDEWLFYNHIRHIPHPRIGKSLKRADQYLPDFDLYIEVDGLDRKDDLDWYGKLEMYSKMQFSYHIIKPVTHYNEDKEKCFLELDKQFSFLKEKTKL